MDFMFRSQKIKWDNLALHLEEISKDICADNGCTEEKHNCESYAYIEDDGTLLDVCCPDYFIPSPVKYANVALPWVGDGLALYNEVQDCIEDYE